MLKELSKTIKTISLILLILGALNAIGYAFNTLIPFEWLGYGFVLLRKTVLLLDFAIDTNVLFLTITIWINVLVLYWLYLGGDWIIKKLER